MNEQRSLFGEPAKTHPPGGHYRGKTDRRFQDYHYTWPADYWYIDLDGVEVCQRCRQPLILYEVSRDVEKPTSILANIGERAALHAVLIIVPNGGVEFDDSTPVQWAWIVEDGVAHRGMRTWNRGTLGDWRAEVDSVRAEHKETHR